MDYGFIHDGHVFTPNASTVGPEKNENRNKQIASMELQVWKKRPAKFVAYIREAKVNADVTLWLGDVIGTIKNVTQAKQFTPSGMPFTMVYVTVEGSNDLIYHGRYKSDDREVVILHRKKMQRYPDD